MKFKMTKKGVDSYIFALKSRLNYIKKEFSKDLKQNLEILSPKRTGKLASSYVLTTFNQNIQITNVCGYCKYVNDGTRFQSGQHFIEQAYTISKQKLDSIIKNSQKIHH